MTSKDRVASYCSKAWARRFRRHLRAELEGVVPDPRGLGRDAQRRAVSMFHKLGPVPSDVRDRTTLACCCLVLAAYRELLSHTSEDEATEHLRAAVGRVFQKPTRLLVRVWLWFHRHPIRRLSNNWWRRQSQRMYGSGMEFDQDDSEGRVDLIVRRCAFHKFFVEHGAPHLTRAFCAWDRNWMDVVDAAGRTVRTERPTTISTGGDCCRFRLIASDDRSTPDKTDVVLMPPTGIE